MAEAKWYWDWKRLYEYYNDIDEFIYEHFDEVDHRYEGVRLSLMDEGNWDMYDEFMNELVTKYGVEPLELAKPERLTEVEITLTPIYEFKSDFAMQATRPPLAHEVMVDGLTQSINITHTLEYVDPNFEFIFHTVTRKSFDVTFVPYQHIKRKTGRIVQLKELKLLLQIGGIELNPGPNGRGPSVKRRPRKPYRQTGGNRGGQTATHMVPLKINKPRRFMRGMPSSFFITFTYVIPMQQVVGGGTTNSLRFRSEAYDVDPALGSTAMAYFSELGAIYSRFRVHNMHYEYNVTNQEAFPIQMIHGYSPLVFSSTALGANYAENRFFRTFILSPINGARSTCTLRQTISTGTLFGMVNPYTDDLFLGSTTSATLSSSATINSYIGGISAAVPVNGFFVGGSVRLDIELCRRNDIIN